MNIIYQIENLNKKPGEKRFYIGQKVECRVEKVNNIGTVINNRTELPYFGSSSDLDMIEELKKGDIFEATILEIVNDKKIMCEREEYYIRLNNAVESLEYYNKVYPLVYNKRDFQNTPKNIYGETYKEYASSSSSLAKRNNNCIKMGFKSIDDFYIDFYEKFKTTQNYTELARYYNITRHRLFDTVSGVNLEKFIKEINSKTLKIKNIIVEMRANGASIKKIAKDLNLENATVLNYVGIDKIRNNVFIVAERKGLTPDQLGYKIMDLFLKGKDLDVVAKELTLSDTQVRRYFQRFIRKHIEINDFSEMK